MNGNGVALSAEQLTRLTESLETVTARLANLENRMNNTEPMPMEGAESMARLKQKITLPDGSMAYVTGENLQAIIENAVKRGMACMAGIETAKPAPQIKLRDYIENVYKPTYFAGLAATTQDTQNQYLRDNVYPFMGDMNMDKITVTTIQAFWNWMGEGKKHGRKKNLTTGTIDNVTKVLNKIFNVAVDTHYLAENPIKRKLLKNPGEKSKHHKAVLPETAQEVREKIPELTDERQRLLMGFMAYDTGMRPEEILGLRWEDINLEKGYLDIRRTVTHPGRNRARVKEGGKTELSARPIILNPALVNILKTATQKTGYIIHGRTPENPACKATYQRTYEKAFKELGLAGYTPYDWRTTFGTEMTELGYSNKQVANMMGHTSTRMVDTVYAERRRGAILENREKIDQKAEHYFSVS